MLEKEGVKLVVAGKFGGNMESAFDEEGIKFIVKEGIVGDVLEKI